LVFVEVSAERKRRRRGDALMALGLFAVAAAVFSGTLGHGFVWDDTAIIRDNPFFRSPGAWWRCFGRDFGLEIVRRPVGYYRPLVFLSFLLDYAVGGFHPFLYHLTNVLLHAANTVLLFLILRRLIGRSAGAIAAALFAVHPIHTESVAFVSGRSDLLCAFFLFLALLATIRSFESAGRTARRAWTAVSALAYSGALLSKELAVVFPAVLFAYGLIRGYRLKSLVRLLLPTVVVAAAYLGFRLAFFPMAGFGHLARHSGEGVLERSARLLFLYAAQQTFPVIPTLGAEVLARRPLVDAAAVGLLALVVVAAKPRRQMFAALAWLVLFLAPPFWVCLFGAMPPTDRFAYVPSAGVCVLGALALERARKRTWVANAVLLVVFLAFGALSVVFGRMWRDSISLWSATVIYHPRCGRSYYNLGNAYWRKGDLTRAVWMLRKATRLLPDDERRCWAYSNLAYVLAEAGKDALAIKACRAAIRLRPGRVGIRSLLASVLSDEGRHREAIDELRKALEIAPRNSGLCLDLAHEYLALDPPDLENARNCYARARRLGASRDKEIESVLGVTEREGRGPAKAPSVPRKQ